MRILIAALLALVTGVAAVGCEPVPPEMMGYPSPARVGTPAGWTPTTTHQGDLDITVAGTVVEDIEVNGSINVKANDVTIRRARVNGRVWTQHGTANGLRQFSVTVEDSVLGGTSEAMSRRTTEGVIGPGNYTIRHSELYGSDGFRVSQPAGGGTNDVLAEDNFFRANVVDCSQGYHKDGVQGYGGGQNVTFRHNTIEATGCGVTAAVFFANNSKSATVEDNLLIGAGYTLRIHDDANPDVGPWNITGNRIVPSGYGPVNNNGTDCSASSMNWADNRLATVDANYDLTTTGNLVPC